MSKTFKIDRDLHGLGVNIYRKEQITIEPGITILVGCNGWGKSTLLDQIKDNLNYENIRFIYFDNLHDGNRTSIADAISRGNVRFASSMLCSSEGEGIINNVCKLAGQMGDYIREATQNEYFILLDAIDSGLSIDNVVMIKEQLFNTIIEDVKSRGKTVYIIVSANEFEMCNGEKCLDPYEGKYREFKTYNAYRNFILRTAKLKEKRYEK